MLVLDFALSAAIFFVLPGIAHQDLDSMLQGILFAGPLQWTGILFWSTFATSLLFILFVAAVLVLRIVIPVVRSVATLDRMFPVYTHPVRLVAIVMVILLTIGIGIGLIADWATRQLVL
jgi:hypothetical protein